MFFQLALIQNLFPEIGDVIEWNDEHHIVDSDLENQFFAGKNPDTWDGGDAQGYNVSITVSTHVARRSQLKLKEIWDGVDGKFDSLISGVGTGGTISGVGTFLKEKNKNIKIIGVDAFGSALKKFHETGEFDESEIYPYRIEGMGKNLIPTSTDFKVIDHYEKVGDEESAHCAREIASKEGLFVGYTLSLIHISEPTRPY